MSKSRRAQTGQVNMKLGRLALAASMALMLSACGVVKDSVDILPKEQTNEETAANTDAIRIEVVVESDGESIVDLEVDIKGRKNSEQVKHATTKTPYKEEFTVPKDVFLPLEATHVTAGIAEDASWVSCTVRYDGEVVATHKARGDGAKAVCDKTFQWGPG